MEEIEIFKTAESPTGERIKLFVDELEALEPIVNVDTPRDFPLQPCVAPGMDLDFMLEIDEELE
jgi:hypothetical protein